MCGPWKPRPRFAEMLTDAQLEELTAIGLTDREIANLLVQCILENGHEIAMIGRWDPNV
jgi:hypothetical protein